MHTALICLGRYPRPGAVKTRLIPALGADNAAEFQRLTTEYTLYTAGRAADRLAARVSFGFAGGNRGSVRRWLGKDTAFFRQRGQDLGERMAGAFARAFRRGASRAIMIGTDCPGLNPGLLVRAATLLERRGAVLGPARDGGYYLIGLTRPVPDLFRDMPWGTSEVSRRTLAKMKTLGIEPAVLHELHDVDRPEDLPAWEGARRGFSAGAPAISVIVPALNEERRLPGTVLKLREAPGVEIIVADGGSTDRTRDVAVASGAKVLTCSRGRGAQANEGARLAKGRILLFWHADVTPPRGYEITIRFLLAQKDVAAGVFTLGIDAPEKTYRCLEYWIRQRVRWLGLPYGDQGLFMTREKYEQIGGIPELPIMEDLAAVGKLKQRGRILVSPGRALCSARRWQRLGIGRTFLINQSMLAGRALGIPLERLAKWYRGR